MSKTNPLKISTLICIVIILLLVNESTAYAQTKFLRKSYVISVTKTDSVHYLKDKFIIKDSLALYSDSLLLIHGQDYIFDSQKKMIKFLPKLFLKFDKPEFIDVRISYSLLPYDFKEEYKHREIVELKDSSDLKILKSVEYSGKNYLNEIIGGDVQTSGSLVRGFTFGTNRDLTLNSGFQMQMSGKLSENLDISASLTDENIPIQPEGNTQTLQEIDKVFIELKAKNINATLGDFNLNFTKGEFSRINRKLQGVMGSAIYKSGKTESNFLVSGAITKGKYHTNYFNGIEGVQGPYRLTGKNNERQIIIIAGTERVFVDGELMKRGDDNDYIIDYSTGEITFAPRRLINGNSRIVVDFEYTDRQYARNFLTATNSTSVFNNDAIISSSFFYEADDYNNPIDLILSDQERELLKQAGDDRNKTTLETAQYVGKGRGQYIKRDTLINGELLTVFIYAPADSSADYAVSFSYVGEKKGDYQKISSGNFKYVGSGNGNYLPVRFLPFPQQHTLFDVNLQTTPLKFTKIFTEFAFSNFDANRFSKIDDFNNNGKAFSYFVQLNPEKLKIFNSNFGTIDIKAGQRFINSTFNPIDRINEVEYNRKWNLPIDYQVEEKNTEISLIYKPLDFLILNSSYGNLKKGTNFNSNRYEGTVKLNEKSLPTFDYKLELIESKDLLSTEKGNWLRQLLSSEYRYKIFSTSFKYEMENRSIKDNLSNLSKIGSFKFYEYSPRLSITNVFNTNFSIEYKLRRDYQIYKDEIRKESDTYTQIYSLNTTPLLNFYNSFDLTFRRRNYTQEFKQTSGGNTETILIRWLSRYFSSSRAIEAEWLYNISTQKSAKLERVFQKVQKGNGSYIYLGDLDSNGIATEDEFRPTRYDGDFILLTVPSELLIPVIDLKLNGRLKLNFSKIFNGENTLVRLLSLFSTETFFRIEEKNSITNQRKIYLLNFKYFLNENWTINGNNYFQHDLNILENNENLNFRLRFNQRKGLAKYSLSTERAYSRDRSLRIRWQLIPEIVNIIDFENKRDQLSSEVMNYRVRNLYGNFVSSDWIYRLSRRFDLGFKIRLGKYENKQSITKEISNINTQNVRFNYSFDEKGIARFEFSREEVTLEGVGKNLPYELTEGRIVGKTFLWRVGVDYRITNFIQANLGYDGRKESRYRIIHQMRGEVRAFF